MSDANCTISDVAAVIERDVKLATDLLSLANSVLFRGSAAVASLHQAVPRLGFRACRNFILTSSVAGMMESISVDQQRIREQLCRHGFTTAMMSLHLNRALKLGFQGEEFTAGLIHDLGRVLLAAAVPDRIAEVDPLDFVEGPETLEHERALLDTDHCAVGAWFAARSEIPASLIEVVLQHHTPDIVGTNAKLVLLTAAADHMANYLEQNEPAEGYDQTENEALTVLFDTCACSVEIPHTVMDAVRSDVEKMSGPLG